MEMNKSENLVNIKLPRMDGVMVIAQNLFHLIHQTNQGFGVLC